MRVPDITPQFNSYILDWLAFTLPASTEIEQAEIVRFWCDILGDPKPRDGAFYGYTNAIQVAGFGQVMWHPERLEMGVHVQLPSRALSHMGYSPVDLLEMVEIAGGKISRFDVAIDTDKIWIDEFWKRMQAGELVTKSRRGTRVVGFNPSNMEDANGATIYIGAPGSRRRVRIYDKAAEQGEFGCWTRIEVQCRKEHAVRAAAHVMGGGSPADLIVSSIDFREITTDSNTSRRPRSEWFLSLLGGAGERISFAIAQADKTILRLRDWLERQCAPSMAALSIAYNHDQTWLHEIISDGVPRVNSWQTQAALEFRGV